MTAAAARRESEPESESDQRLRRIGEVADEVGTTTRTIRYYEQLGLLNDADGRAKGTHRLYSQADVDRLRELIRLRDLLNLSLEELTQLADAAQLRQLLRAEWLHTTADRERIAIVRQSIENVERQLELVHSRQRALTEFEAELIAKLEQLNEKLVELDH